MALWNSLFLNKLKEEVSGRMKSTLEDIEPLLKVIKELEDFKEKTVVHQVTFMTQIRTLQNQIDTLKTALNETSISLQAINEKIEKMNPVTEAEVITAAAALINEPAKPNEYDVSNRQRIKAQKSTHDDSELPNMKQLEERVQALEQRSMFELQSQMDMGTHMPNEVQLRERKQNNLILFGLHDVSQDGGSDKDFVATLFHDLGVEIDLAETSIFRVGRAGTDGQRPIIIKLENQEKKAHILFKAKNLKNNKKWQ